MPTIRLPNVALGLVALAISQVSLADQVHFNGQTTANDLLIKDTLENILLFARATEKCSSLEAVDAVILPTNYAPSDPHYRAGKGTVTYESWNATLCGKHIKFLISFWPSSEGGTMFAVGYPYPRDAP
jgi:hypothetical protein